MRGLLRSLLGKLGTKMGAGGHHPERLMHLPADIRDPKGLVLYSGPMESDVWPALFVAHSLQRNFSDTELTVIAPARDYRLFNMLSWRPDVFCYEGRPSIPPEMAPDRLDDGSLLFYPYSRVIDSDLQLLDRISCGIRIAPLDEPSPQINLTVRTESPYFPEKLQQMFAILDMEYDAEWRPAVTTQAEHAAAQRMSPVTGRTMPYIVTTDNALAILEKSRAEIPLRTISLAGRKCEFIQLDREIKTAIVAGAKAVATDNDDLWGDACAFDVPAVGLDRQGNFIKWHGKTASREEDGFVEAWVELLKRGW